MTTRQKLALILAVATSGCAVPSLSPPESPRETRGGYQVQQAMARLYPVSTTSSSELSDRGTIFATGRATDANTDLEWASADWDGSPTYTLNFGLIQRFDRIRIKTGPALGTTYRVETTSDGVNWRDISGPLANSGWNTEEKIVSGLGNALRVRFYNTSPPAVKHFSIFELEVYGAAGGTLPPPPPPPPPVTAEGLTYSGLTGDQMSSTAVGADGTTDGMFSLTVNLSQPAEIRNLMLYGLDANGNRDGSIWNTGVSSNWLLGATWPASPALTSYRATLGNFNAGPVTFTLYATQYLNTFTRANALVEAEVNFGDGTKRTFRLRLT